MGGHLFFLKVKSFKTKVFFIRFYNKVIIIISSSSSSSSGIFIIIIVSYLSLLFITKIRGVSKYLNFLVSPSQDKRARHSVSIRSLSSIYPARTRTTTEGK